MRGETNKLNKLSIDHECGPSEPRPHHGAGPHQYLLDSPISQHLIQLTASLIWELFLWDDDCWILTLNLAPQYFIAFWLLSQRVLETESTNLRFALFTGKENNVSIAKDPFGILIKPPGVTGEMDYWFVKTLVFWLFYFFFGNSGINKGMPFEVYIIRNEWTTRRPDPCGASQYTWYDDDVGEAKWKRSTQSVLYGVTFLLFIYIYTAWQV